MSDKAADKASRSVDDIFDFDLGPDGALGALGMGSVENLPESYDFDYIYSLRLDIPAQKKMPQMTMNYYLKKDATYWGNSMSMNTNMFMVYDTDLNKMAMFMNMDSGGMITVTNLDLDGALEDQEYEMTYSIIAGKTIMGYPCEGFKAVNDEYEMTSYVTFDAPIGFVNSMGKNAKMPKGFQKEWMTKNGRDGLLMHMTMVDKKKAKNNMTMECVGFEKKTFRIKKADYKGLAGK